VAEPVEAGGTSGFADAWWPMVPRLSTIAGANE
jgi:hypothetical protein